MAGTVVVCGAHSVRNICLCDGSAAAPSLCGIVRGFDGPQGSCVQACEVFEVAPTHRANARERVVETLTSGSGGVARVSHRDCKLLLVMSVRRRVKVMRQLFGGEGVTALAALDRFDAADSHGIDTCRGVHETRLTNKQFLCDRVFTVATSLQVNWNALTVEVSGLAQQDAVQFARLLLTKPHFGSVLFAGAHAGMMRLRRRETWSKPDTRVFATRVLRVVPSSNHEKCLPGEAQDMQVFVISTSVQQAAAELAAVSAACAMQQTRHACVLRHISSIDALRSTIDSFGYAADVSTQWLQRIQAALAAKEKFAFFDK